MVRIRKPNPVVQRFIITPLLVIFSFIFLFFLADRIFSKPPSKIDYGITFSAFYAKSLGLNSDEVYRSILDDLKVKHLRIPVYWNLSEPLPGLFDFSSIDPMLNMAKSRGVQVTLVVGRKLPRWPECFQPDWATPLPEQEYKDRVLEMIGKTVDHFKGRSEIVAWQVENEPFLDFGICRKISTDLLKSEIEIVKDKDTTRPIILTDSGELGAWIYPMRMSDRMGTTLYRTVWNSWFGFIDYPIPPLFYRVKAYLIQKIFAPSSKGVFLTELQAEPWPPGKPLTQVEINDQIRIFGLKQFQEVIEYAARTGFSQEYLWGAEWWYYMKQHGHPEYWNFAKILFK